MIPAITIIGLGPGPARFRTIAAQEALANAKHIFVRGHEDVGMGDLLGAENVTDLQQFHDPNATNRWHQSAAVVIASAQVDPVVLAIPGHPRFGEGLVETVLKSATEIGLTTQVIDGISATDLLASALGIDPIRDRVQMASGWQIAATNRKSPFEGGLLNFSPRLPVLITHVYNNELMQAASNQLARVFPPDHVVELISAAGLENEQRESSTIAELADHSGGPLLAIYVPAQSDLEATASAATLQHVMAALRDDDGCPWDRKQTNATLAKSLADEVYEVIDAIDSGDDENLAEELGDLLMLIMMHTQIAEERGAFRLEDVYSGIVTKIVRRHPHVFGDDAATNADEVVGLWQRVKAQEKAEKPNRPEKAADGQPHSMPALERATRVLKKHPIEVADSEPGGRRQALLDAVAAIIAADEDPNDVLKQALEQHVTGSVTAGNSGE